MHINCRCINKNKFKILTSGVIGTLWKQNTQTSLHLRGGLYQNYTIAKKIHQEPENWKKIAVKFLSDPRFGENDERLYGLLNIFINYNPVY